MTNRSFVVAVTAVAALALLILMDNVRQATSPVFGPPNVDKGKVMSMVERGDLSFNKARFYVVEEATPGSSATCETGAGARPAKEGR